MNNLCTIEYRVYIEKMRFLARSMKTKELFWRYPRKISLLKDLREGISRAFLLGKSMKTGGRLGVPSKISLLKDLAGTVRRLGLVFPGHRDAPAREISEIVKEPKNHRRYQTANELLSILA